MNHSRFPEAVQLGAGRRYPWLADLRLNAWAFVAVLVAAGSRWALRSHGEWELWTRALVALTPLLPGLLWVRSLVRWIRRLDELQQRLQTVACLIALTATVLFSTALTLLSAAGVLQGTRLNGGLGWEGTWASVVGFFVLGNWVANRAIQ